MTPESAMRLALAQARKASGRSFPNPPVGAVLLRGERVLGRGHTQTVGGAHAEVKALESALRRHGPRAVRGATLAVTLEPCAHTGRTPPCADRLIEGGLRRVWVGHRDPHPEVAGKGLRRLKRAGIEVARGVLEAECREQHRGFLSAVERRRPFVVLKLAASLDGRIATASGESRWITGPKARAAGHALRNRVDAIWVGSETALVDDPTLTARRGGSVTHRPIRLVADTRLRLPTTARLLRGAAGSAWVLCGRGAPAARRRALETAGARVIEIARAGAHLNLARALTCLAREGLTEVLVEGGGKLAAALLRADLVDELHWFASPALIGADGRPALGALGLRSLASAPRLEVVATRRLGDDQHWTLRPRRGSARR